MRTIKDMNIRMEEIPKLKDSFKLDRSANLGACFGMLAVAGSTMYEISQYPTTAGIVVLAFSGVCAIVTGTNVVANNVNLKRLENEQFKLRKDEWRQKMYQKTIVKEIKNHFDTENEQKKLTKHK